MSDLLGIGAAGVKAYRSALSTVSDNITNVETPGYSRRDIRLQEMPGAGTGNVLYRGEFAAGGVTANGIARAWDDFKANDARAASSDAGRSDAKVTWLTAAENAVPSDDTGSGAKLNKFFGSLTKLSADPNGWLPRQTAITSLSDAVTAIKTDANALARVSSGIGDATKANVQTLNSNLAALAEVNIALARSAPGSASQANLQDQRDSLLETISGSVAITTSFDAQGGATVKLAGATPETLVSGNTTAQVGAVVAANGTIQLTVTGATTTNVTATGGSLAGLVDSAATVSAERSTLDGIAADFAGQVNRWNGFGATAAGTPGGDLLTIGADGAATLALATTDPAAIAAASADGTVANGNVLDLTAMRGADGAEQRMSNLVLGAASTLNTAKAEQSATGARRDAAKAALSEVAGVDLDREAAELIRFQQAYEGSARVIQVARETLQSILNIF